MKTLILVFVGGGAGSCCRYALSAWLNPQFRLFPAGTLLANVLSCVVLGYFAVYLAGKLPLSDDLKKLVLIGFCGGFSTFSTFSNELLGLLKQQAWAALLLYLVSSLLLSLLALLLGMYLGQQTP